MSDSWVVQNLENALNTWNSKLAEVWQLITQSPETFKGGAIWAVVRNIHGGLQTPRGSDKTLHSFCYRQGGCNLWDGVDDGSL